MKYERGLYYLHGNVIGRIKNFEPNIWYGHITLNGMEDGAEYGTLDFDAKVETPDGKIWNVPATLLKSAGYTKAICKLCDAEFNIDSDLKNRQDRHEHGRHQGHSVFNERDNGKSVISKPLGYFIIGKVDWRYE